MINFKAKFARAAAAHLYETPLSEDQVIEEMEGGYVIITATVRDTAQLDWWLSGFGSMVEVQEPPELRRRMIRGGSVIKYHLSQLRYRESRSGGAS